MSHTFTERTHITGSMLSDLGLYRYEIVNADGSRCPIRAFTVEPGQTIMAAVEAGLAEGSRVQPRGLAGQASSVIAA